MTWRFEAKKGDLATTRWRDEAPAALKDGEARLAVRRFALTSNNITYGLMGEGMGYWDFFPAPEGWGVIPAWGFADVVESRSADVAVGERVYGYLPMAGAFNAEIGRARADGFVDIAAHRAERAPVYNQYTRVGADALYDASKEAEQALFRPLFGTSFVIDYYLASGQNFGAEQIVLASASSKTALSTAFFLAKTKTAKVVGLTSAANRAFVEKLGVYDEVVLYDDIASLKRVPTTVVDYAGSGPVLLKLDAHLDGVLQHVLFIGVTHWPETTGAPPQTKVKPVMFFAPDQMRKASEEWGAAEFNRRMGASWRDFLQFSARWLKVDTARDRAGLERLYAAVRDGKLPADTGAMIELPS